MQTPSARLFYYVSYADEVKGPLDIDLFDFQLTVKRFDTEKNVFSGEFDFVGSLFLWDKKTIAFEVRSGKFDIRINSSLVSSFKDWKYDFPDELWDIVIPEHFSDEDDKWSWSRTDGGRNSGVY